MKPYLIVTGLLFSLLALLHLWRGATHWDQLAGDSHQMLFNTAVTVISAALGAWAWLLLWRSLRRP